MCSSISLLDMPDVAMSKILEKCDFVSIIILRKTCHDLRNFIDYTRPEQTLRDMSVFGFRHDFSMTFSFGENHECYPEGQTIILHYFHGETVWERSDKDRKTTWKAGKKRLGRDDVSAVILKDLQNILNFKLSILNYCSFYDEESEYHLLSIMSTALLARAEFLKTKDLTVSGYYQEEIPPILSCICPDSLKELIFQRTCFKEEPTIMKGLTELELWKKVETFDCKWFYYSEPIDDFIHFNSAAFTLKRVSTDTLSSLKEIFLYSPSNTKHFQLRLEYTISQEDLLKVFGPHFIEDVEAKKKQWFFKRNSNNFFEVTLTRVWSAWNNLDYMIVNRAKISDNAFIIG